MTETPSILLVDDNAGHRMLIQRALRRAGITLPFVEAASVAEGEKCLEGAAGGRYGLVILDLHLVDARGTKLLLSMRSRKELNDVPVIMLSTSSLDRDIKESMDAGAAGYIVKTNDLAQLAADITDTITRVAPQVCQSRE